MRRRTGAIAARFTERDTGRTLGRIAATLGIAPELLRTETIALQRRFTDAGVVSEAGQIALVASELNMSSEELKQEIAQVLAAC